MSAKETPPRAEQPPQQNAPSGAWYRACVDALKAEKPLPPLPEVKK